MNQLVAALFIAVVSIFAFAGVTASGADRPNVLFLLTDDQRADSIAALGNAVIRTPNLDELANRGFVFTNAYCMGSTMPAVCNPSRHMIMTGMSLFRYDENQKEGTFGDVIRKAGYITYHLSKRGNTARVPHTAFEYSRYLDDEKERTSGHHGRAAADQAIDFLNNTWRRNRPLFMYIGFEGPHDPRVAAREWLDFYDREQIPLPANFLPHHPFNNGELLIRDERLASWPRTENVVREHLHDYYACITSIDHQIGRIVAALDALGELENTIIVFSSDHGLAIGSHGLFGKQSLYEHSMKSPLIFAGLGIPHGRSDTFVYLHDIFPTVVDLVGVDSPANLDGKSLAPIIRGEGESFRDTVFLAYKDVQRAVRHGDWKLIRYPQVNVTQLFNLADDPHEANDLSGDPAYKGVVDELHARLREQQVHFDDSAQLTVESPQPAEVDETFFARDE
jgi:arylsulfatase A-like enzyme